VLVATAPDCEEGGWAERVNNDANDLFMVGNGRILQPDGALSGRDGSLISQ